MVIGSSLAVLSGKGKAVPGVKTLQPRVLVAAWKQNSLNAPQPVLNHLNAFCSLFLPAFSMKEATEVDSKSLAALKGTYLVTALLQHEAQPIYINALTTRQGSRQSTGIRPFINPHFHLQSHQDLCQTLKSHETLSPSTKSCRGAKSGFQTHNSWILVS